MDLRIRPPGFGLVISGCCDDAYLPILAEFRALSEPPLDRYLSIDANVTRPHLLTWNVSEHTPAIPLIALECRRLTTIDR